MSNLLLLCHGALMEFSSFELGDDQAVQYRGNFGALLSGQVARSITAALLADPLVTDTQLARAIPNYTPQPPCEGPTWGSRATTSYCVFS